MGLKKHRTLYEDGRHPKKANGNSLAAGRLALRDMEFEIAQCFDLVSARVTRRVWCRWT